MSVLVIQNGIDRKLLRLVGYAHLGVSAPAKNLSDIKAEVGSQRPAKVEAKSQRSADAEVEDKRSEGQRSPESKSRGPRLAGSGPELKDK